MEVMRILVFKQKHSEGAHIIKSPSHFMPSLSELLLL